MKYTPIFFALILLFACHKDKDTSACRDLEASWNCVSWTEDNVQLLGTGELITASQLEFYPYTDSIGQGDLEWNIQYVIGGSELIIGSYMLNDRCNEVTLTPKSGDPSTYDFIITEDKLELSGEFNNATVALTFTR